MKKIFALILALVAVNAFAIVQKEAPEFYTTQYWVVTYTFSVFPVGEKTDRGLRIVNYEAVKRMEIIRIRFKDGHDLFDVASLNAEGELEWTPLKGRKSFLAYRNEEGSMIGYFYFEREFSRGEGIPAAKAIVAGKVKGFSYNKKRGSWIASSGGGEAVLYNEPQDFEAWNKLEPATDIGSDKILASSASVNVAIYSYLTGMQLVRQYTDAARCYKWRR